MFVRIRMIALCAGGLASAILAADGWAGPSDRYRLDETFRLSSSADEPLQGTFPLVPLSATLTPVEASGRPTRFYFSIRAVAHPAEGTPEASLAEESSLEASDTSETLDFDVPIIR